VQGIRLAALRVPPGPGYRFLFARVPREHRRIVRRQSTPLAGGSRPPRALQTHYSLDLGISSPIKLRDNDGSRSNESTYIYFESCDQLEKFTAIKPLDFVSVSCINTSRTWGIDPKCRES
jgi:hypothetical protein